MISTIGLKPGHQRQFANVNGTESDIKIIIYGVPEGLLLGPRLFFIHVNDLPEFVKGGLVAFCLCSQMTPTIYC